MLKNLRHWLVITKNDFTSFFWRQSGLLTSFIGLFIMSFVVGHYVILQTDAYAISENYVRENSSLASYLGPIQTIGLEPLAQSIKWNGSSGIAELELYAVGQKKHCLVRTYLKKVNGTWQLEKAHALTPDHDVIILK